MQATSAPARSATAPAMPMWSMCWWVTITSPTSPMTSPWAARPASSSA